MLVPHAPLGFVVKGSHGQLLRNRGRDIAPALGAVPGRQIRRCDGHDAISALDPVSDCPAQELARRLHRAAA